MNETYGESRALDTPPRSPKTDELSTSENMRGEGRPFAWLPLIAISFCLTAHTVALSSLLTYMGVFVQYLLDLPSLNASGETLYGVIFASVRVGIGFEPTQP